MCTNEADNHLASVLLSIIDTHTVKTIILAERALEGSLGIYNNEITISLYTTALQNSSERLSKLNKYHMKNQSNQLEIHERHN